MNPVSGYHSQPTRVRMSCDTRLPFACLCVRLAGWLAASFPVSVCLCASPSFSHLSSCTLVHFLCGTSGCPYMTFWIENPHLNHRARPHSSPPVSGEGI